MANKKTTPVKEKQFIAFDNYTDTILVRGSRKDVLSVIELYVEEQGYDENDVEENIQVFELGEERDVRAFPKGLEIAIA